jgi:transposase-like protein
MLSNSFKWKHYAGEIILLNVRWYLKYSLSYRNLKEMMAERGVTVDHTTIMRWVHQYSPEIEKKVRRYLRPTNDSWRMDETYIRVKGEWKYLYRAVDSNGNTIDFMLSAKRNKKAAKRFLNRLSQNSSGLYIWVINIGIFIFFKDIYYIKSILLKKINSSVSHVQKVRSKAAIFTSIESGRVCF